MKKKKVDFVQEKDILGLDKPPVFISQNQKSDKLNLKEKINHANRFELPLIKTRYFSMLIDTLVIVAISLGITSLFENVGEVPDYIRGIMFLVVFFLYEPILISTGCTIGQLFTDIRVREFKDPTKKIWIFNAILRLLIKGTLGWISFFTVTFNTNRRAMHDFASGSIVIVPKN